MGDCRGLKSTVRSGCVPSCLRREEGFVNSPFINYLSQIGIERSQSVRRQDGGPGTQPKKGRHTGHFSTTFPVVGSEESWTTTRRGLSETRVTSPEVGQHTTIYKLCPRGFSCPNLNDQGNHIY